MHMKHMRYLVYDEDDDIGNHYNADDDAGIQYGDAGAILLWNLAFNGGGK